jgi:zinc finger-like protein
MRCNACIDMEEYDTHVCISQRLQGSCPICREDMFESTEPLRGMKCGHVMHLSCYNEYASRCFFGRITCPLCKQVFDNMRG